MLLASLIQMTKEEEEDRREPKSIARASGTQGKQHKVQESHGCASLWRRQRQWQRGLQRSLGGESSLGVAQGVPRGGRFVRLGDQRVCCLMPAGMPSSGSGAECVQAHPLIRVPRCLRRNSSHYGYAEPGPHVRYCRSSQRRRRRRVSTISKAGSPWPGRGLPLPNRRSSTCYRGHATLNPLLGAYYDPSLESWSGFLSYVKPFCYCVYLLIFHAVLVN